MKPHPPQCHPLTGSVTIKKGLENHANVSIMPLSTTAILMKVAGKQIGKLAYRNVVHECSMPLPNIGLGVVDKCYCPFPILSLEMLTKLHLSDRAQRC